MPNRYYTGFKSLKISGKGVKELAKSGSVPSMPEKSAFPSAALPGKAQGKNRGNGVKKCNIYPKSIGL